MWTSTLLEDEALRLQPAMVMLLNTAAPASGIATSVPLVPLQPPVPPVTVSVNVVACVAEAPVPVILIVYVPAGVDVVVATVSVDEPPEVTDAGLNDAVAPLGKPLALSATLCALPAVVAVLTVAVTEPP